MDLAKGKLSLSNDFDEDVEHVERGHSQAKSSKQPVDLQQHSLYHEALARYPNDESIDQAQERAVVRKLDRRILPLLGVCYFFYYVDKTTLYVVSIVKDSLCGSTTDPGLTFAHSSYAAIFGLKDGLNLKGEEYSWLSSSFYFGWLVWAIPSNLIMQRCPPA